MRQHTPPTKRVPLEAEDEAELSTIADLYDNAVKLYGVADGWLKTKDAVRYRRTLAQATATRERAVRRLIEWASKRLLEHPEGVGYPYGSNHPRLQKGYDHRYNFRKWGHGASAQAASFLRSVVKRGWL